MKRSVFDALKPEVQKEFLERGGLVEGINAPSTYFSSYMRFNYSTSFGKQGRPKKKRKQSQKKDR